MFRGLVLSLLRHTTQRLFDRRSHRGAAERPLRPLEQLVVQFDRCSSCHVYILYDSYICRLRRVSIIWRSRSGNLELDQPLPLPRVIECPAVGCCASTGAAFAAELLAGDLPSDVVLVDLERLYQGG